MWWQIVREIEIVRKMEMVRANEENDTWRR
jgi:hypothetical protein